MTANISAELASFAVGFRPEGLAQKVRTETCRAILNGLAAGLGGSSDEAVRILIDAMSVFAGAATSTVIGRSTRTDAATAAFINAAAINVLDFDDTHEGTIIHPTAPVAAALFALAEANGKSGIETIDAIAIGIETACRIGNAVSPGHYARGWHITATCGVFGAAMGCARLIGLTERQALDALGAASSQSSGLVETLGTMAKSVGVGHAARAGLLSALLAAKGLRGPDRPLEGRLGFLPVTACPPDADRVTDRLGEFWELNRNMYKPYPCGVVLNPVIDACLSLRLSLSFSPDEIRSVTVTGSELLRMRTDRPGVRTGREAQVSVQHAVAVSLLRGTASAADFSDGSVLDPHVLSLRSRVKRIVVDAAMAEDAARVDVHLSSGQVLTQSIERARGSLANPLSDSDIERKFRDLASHGAPGIDVEKVLEAIVQLPKVYDVRNVMSTLRPS